MAEIVETLLDTTSRNNNFIAVYNYLQNNIDGYFDTVEINQNYDSIALKINGDSKITIQKTSYHTIFYSTTGNSTTINGDAWQPELFNKAFSTSNGFCLLTVSGYGFFVAKDSNNDTFYVMFSRNGNGWGYVAFTSSSSERIIGKTQEIGNTTSAAYQNSPAYWIQSWFQQYGNSKITDYKTQKTMLEPLMTYEGAYTPNLFLTPYSQYTGTVGIIQIDGTDYVYNGYCALKGVKK